MRLDKFLTQMQLGTRSQVKDEIKKGKITVNQVIIKKPEYQIDEKKDVITCNGQELCFQRYHYYMLHKPAGVVTANKDAHDRTVMDLLPNDIGKNLSPVGRLDKDTEGLLLITNDGELSHKLLSPKKHVNKTYYAECSGLVTDEKLDMLRQGVDIGDDKPTLPAQISLISEDKDTRTFCLHLTITEGRFHQIKRMVHAIGGEVTYLKRISMGDLILDENLPKGEFRPLTEEEIKQLYNGRM